MRALFARPVPKGRGVVLVFLMKRDLGSLGFVLLFACKALAAIQTVVCCRFEGRRILSISPP